jgi:hypothetical protein
MIHNCIYLPILFLLSDKCLKNITSYDGISNKITSIISNLYNLEKPCNIKYQIIDKFHTSLFSDINKKQETEDKQLYTNMNIDFFRLYMLKIINKVSGDKTIYNLDINDIIRISHSILNRSSYSLGPSDQLMTDQIGGDECDGCAEILLYCCLCNCCSSTSNSNSISTNECKGCCKCCPKWCDCNDEKQPPQPPISQPQSNAPPYVQSSYVQPLQQSYPAPYYTPQSLFNQPQAQNVQPYPPFPKS